VSLACVVPVFSNSVVGVVEPPPVVHPVDVSPGRPSGKLLVDPHFAVGRVVALRLVAAAAAVVGSCRSTVAVLGSIVVATVLSVVALVATESIPVPPLDWAGDLPLLVVPMVCGPALSLRSRRS